MEIKEAKTMNDGIVMRRAPVGLLRSELERAFEQAFGGGLSPLIGRAGQRRSDFPALNVWEGEDELYAEAEVPGLRMEDLEILVQGSELTIRGERTVEELEGVKYHRRERGTGSFHGMVRLPVEVDVEKIEARLENGVLTIVMPKAARARPRKIEVKTASR